MAKTTADEQALDEHRRLIGRRVDELRRERGIPAKELYGDMGWDKSAYSRKHRGQTPIEDDEIMALRRLLNEPAPWPFVSIQESMLLKALGKRATEALEHLKEIEALLDEKRRKR